MSNERLRRGVGLGIFAMFMFATGEIAGSSRHPGLPPLAAARAVSFGADGGAGIPANASPVTEEDLRPGGPLTGATCDGRSCPLPDHGPHPVEERHDECTYVQDKGGVVILDRSTLAATSCNEACSVCVEQFARNDCQYDCILEGERMDRADQDVRHKRIERVESCMFGGSGEDASPEDSGYVISHVRVVPGAAFHFDPKSGAYTADEN